MRHLKTLCSVLALTSMFATAHAQSVPPGCAMYLVSVSVASGTPSYTRLRYEIEALRSAQDGVTSMTEGLKDFKTASEPAAALAALITGTNEANNDLHCAALVMSKYKSAGKDDEVIKTLMIHAFNQEAEVVMILQADMKKKMLVALGRAEQDDVVKDAEKLSAMKAEQSDAYDSLLMAAEESLMLAIDLSDMKAKNTAKSTLSCPEFKELKKKSSAILVGQKSAYRDDASLFMKFLDGHECKAM